MSVPYTTIDMYLDRDDLPILLDWLNNEEDVAFVVPDAAMRLQACRRLDDLLGGRYCLWNLHVPFPGQSSCRVIEHGWTTTGSEGYNPLPLNHFPGLYYMTIAGCNDAEVGLSRICWVGNHASSQGIYASPPTREWWQRARKWVKKQVRVPRGGPGGRRRDIAWAFPAAWQRIQAGCPCAISPPLTRLGQAFVQITPDNSESLP